MPRAPAGVSSSHLVDAAVASLQKAVPRDALPGEHAASLLQEDHRSSGVLQGWVEDVATNPCPLLNKISSVIPPLLCKLRRKVPTCQRESKISRISRARSFATLRMTLNVYDFPTSSTQRLPNIVSPS